jgi:predicted nucleic acid-binding protein
MTAAPELILLVTNILVHLVRGNEFGRSVNQSYGLADRKERPLISVVTVGEMLSLAKKLTWGDE